jgi:hypothetical protein
MCVGRGEALLLLLLLLLVLVVVVCGVAVGGSGCGEVKVRRRGESGGPVEFRIEDPSGVKSGEKERERGNESGEGGKVTRLRKRWCAGRQLRRGS